MGTEHLPPEEKTLIGKLGAETSWARTIDKTARTAPARRAAYQRFVDEVDPERMLPREMRERLAQHAQKAHMHRLSLKAAMRARQRRESEAETSDG